jgi:two-component system sensor histidine kinase QseC
MKSLRLRLVLLTTAAVAVVWLLTAIFTWRAALHEIEELLNHPPATAAHMQKERADLAGEIAEHLLKPMLIALPGLALVLVIAVGLSLRPLRRLSDDIAERAPERLTPIDGTEAPREILPLIERLNQLFAEIDRALQNERRFTADAAHELRTPLAALQAQAQVALAATDEATRRHALNQILAACERATRLVAQLLTLARLDAGQAPPMQELGLRALAVDVLAELAGDAIGHDCELVLGDGDAPVRGDPTLLQAALRNLVENALKHGAAHQIELSIGNDDGQAVLCVADDGRGIPAAERESVRQRFRRGASADSCATAAAGQSLPDATGSGLGLSIVDRIVELHGGALSLSEGPGGRGLAVRILLPAIK